GRVLRCALFAGSNAACPFRPSLVSKALPCTAAALSAVRFPNADTSRRSLVRSRVADFHPALTSPLGPSHLSRNHLRLFLRPELASLARCRRLSQKFSRPRPPLPWLRLPRRH